MLFTSDMPTHAQKSRARRVLVAFKRANISCFGPHDRAAAPAPQIYRIYIGLFFLRFVNGNRIDHLCDDSGHGVDTVGINSKITVSNVDTSSVG